MPTGRAFAMGTVAGVADAYYKLQDHLRSRAARREEEDQAKAVLEMLEREAEEGPKGMRRTTESIAFRELENKLQSALLCEALETMFLSLTKAAPPSSAVTALPFLELGESAPATVVLSCVLALGDDVLAWRLFGDDDEQEPRSTAEGRLRKALSSCRSVGLAAGWLSPGGKRAVVDFCRSLSAAKLTPKSNVTLDAVRARLDGDWAPETSVVVTVYCLVSMWFWRRGEPGVTQGQGADSEMALRLAQGLGVGVCRQSALDETGANDISSAVYGNKRPAPTKTYTHDDLLNLGATDLLARLASGVGMPTGENFRLNEYTLTYRKDHRNGGDRDALWLSCSFAPGSGFSVPVHGSSIETQGERFTYMRSLGEATGKQKIAHPPADVVKARAHFLAAMKTAAVGDAWVRALEAEAGSWSLEHVAARRGDLQHIESRRNKEVILEFLRGADEALLSVDPQTVRRALFSALVRVVPDREADEVDIGMDVSQEVDAFATEYSELIHIGLLKVPRLRNGRTPAEVVPDRSVEDAVDGTLGLTHTGSYVRRTRHVLVQRERDRRMSARELAVAYVPLAFRLAFLVAVFLGVVGFSWGTAGALMHHACLPETLAWVLSVALNLWALASMLTQVSALLEVDPGASRWRRAAVVTCRFHEGVARVFAWELPLVTRKRQLQASCGVVVLRWSRRLQRQAFREHLSRGRIRASDACLLLEDVARCRPQRPKRGRQGAKDPLYQYAGDETRGVLPGTRVEAEAPGAAPLPLPSASLVSSLCAVSSGKFAGLLENGPASPKDALTRAQRDELERTGSVAIPGEVPVEPPSPVRPPLPKKRTIEEALEAGGWAFKRGKHHIVFERHVVVSGGRRAKQTFVAASTPSGRGRKNELARINKLNRDGGAAAPADAAPVARRRKKRGNAAARRHVLCSIKLSTVSFANPGFYVGTYSTELSIEVEYTLIGSKREKCAARSGAAPNVRGRRRHERRACPAFYRAVRNRARISLSRRRRRPSRRTWARPRRPTRCAAARARSRRRRHKCRGCSTFFSWGTASRPGRRASPNRPSSLKRPSRPCRAYRSSSWSWRASPCSSSSARGARRRVPPSSSATPWLGAPRAGVTSRPLVRGLALFAGGPRPPSPPRRAGGPGRAPSLSITLSCSQWTWRQGKHTDRLLARTWRARRGH